MVVEVRVKPGSGKDALLFYREPNFLEVSVKAKPEKGEANKALCRFLGRFFGIGKENVKILRGKTSKNKLIKLENLDEKTFRKKVEELKK